MGFRVRLGPLSVSNRGRFGLRAGPVSVYGGGRRRSGRGIIGPVLVVALAVGFLIQYWLYVLVGLVVLAVGWVLLAALVQRPASSNAAVPPESLAEDERAAAEAQQQRLRANGLDWCCLNHKHTYLTRLARTARLTAVQELGSVPEPDLGRPRSGSGDWFCPMAPTMVATCFQTTDGPFALSNQEAEQASLGVTGVRLPDSPVPE